MHKFLSLILLSALSFCLSVHEAHGMEEDELALLSWGLGLLSSKVKKMPPRYPVPPIVTYNDYVNNLCLPEGEMGRWRKPTGNLGGWLQAPANKRGLQGRDGQALVDFPFFQSTLNPAIDENRLRCDYSVPIINPDLSRGPSTLSLFCDATFEEIDAVNKLMPELEADYTARLLQWQEELRKKQQVPNAVLSKILKKEFVPQFVNIDYNRGTVSAPLQKARDERNFLYFNFDGATMQSKSLIDILLSTYDVNVEACKQGSILNLSQDKIGSYAADYLYSDTGYSLSCDGSLSISRGLFDINGPIILKTLHIKLKHVFFWPVGNLILQPYDQSCPIDNIEITACNSMKPILVWARMAFTKTPEVTLECLNASRITLKFRIQPDDILVD